MTPEYPTPTPGKPRPPQENITPRLHRNIEEIRADTSGLYRVLLRFYLYRKLAFSDGKTRQSLSVSPCGSSSPSCCSSSSSYPSFSPCACACAAPRYRSPTRCRCCSYSRRHRRPQRLPRRSLETDGLQRRRPVFAWRRPKRATGAWLVPARLGWVSFCGRRLVWGPVPVRCVVGRFPVVGLVPVRSVVS